MQQSGSYESEKRGIPASVSTSSRIEKKTEIFCSVAKHDRGSLPELIKLNEGSSLDIPLSSVAFTSRHSSWKRYLNNRDVYNRFYIRLSIHNREVYIKDFISDHY
jgi:hypothetical protein